jgi:hypothetical protein
LNKKWILLGIWVVFVLVKIGDKILLNPPIHFLQFREQEKEFKAGTACRRCQPVVCGMAAAQA